MPKKLIRFIVVVTIGGLSLLGVLSIFFIIHTTTTGSHTGHTKQKKAQITLTKLDQAIHEYRLDIGNYPKNLKELAFDNSDTMWMGPYIKEKELKDPWGENYHYYLIEHTKGYQLYTLGSDLSEGGEDQNKDQLSKGSLIIFKPNF